MGMNFVKYKKYEGVNLKNREWPSKTIEKAPIWCSVDLRDGNQALPIPMNIEEKVEMFKLLTEIGFKTIEVGFPSASNTEYNFTRRLIEENLIPDGVAIQVLTQSRRQLLEKTFESLQGAKKAVVHLYNSTSTLQRDVVFGKSKDEIKEIAVEGAKIVKELSEKHVGGEIIYEYSPESFTGTELEYALEVCEAVMDIWQPTPQKKMIINLPSTVEMGTPNIYADRIEWFSKNIKNRDSVTISLHTHNDRGTSVASTELALLAGADRVEGTLFGNGERTGNLDIVNVALNMFSQGIDPELDFSDSEKIIKIYEKCSKMTIHPRHPYYGELVFTAFSGSHQDAIRKGLSIYEDKKPQYWEVPYLPIDPADIGKQYEAIIRINSQSGKGGVAFVMENDFGFKLPKNMHPEFGNTIKDISDKLGDELIPPKIFDIFKAEYLDIDGPFKLKRYEINEKQNYEESDLENKVSINVSISFNGEIKEAKGEGNGPIDAFFQSLKNIGINEFKFIDFNEHALAGGSDAKAVSYIQLENGAGKRKYGVGIAQNIDTASIKALLSSINRFYK